MKARKGDQVAVDSRAMTSQILCLLLLWLTPWGSGANAELAEGTYFQMQLPSGWEFEPGKTPADGSDVGIALLGKGHPARQNSPMVKVLKFQVAARAPESGPNIMGQSSFGKLLSTSVVLPLVEAGYQVKSLETTSSGSPLQMAWSGEMVSTLDGQGTFRTSWKDFVNGGEVIRLVWHGDIAHPAMDWRLIESSFTPRFSDKTAQGGSGMAESRPLSMRAPSDPEADRRASELVSQFGDSLLVVQGKKGAGSGFFCKDAQGTGVYTNIHVAVAEKGLTFKDIRGRAATVGASKAATGRDIVRFDCPDPPAMPLQLVEDFDSTVHIGDPIVVLGNPDGAGVVKPLSGKVVAIGPDLVEVDAEFIPGNSGSPIIHASSGKVIGIATYLIVQKVDALKNRRSETDIRRFGYRVDGVREWQPINWQIMYEDVATLEGVEELTDGLIAFLKDVGADDRINQGPYKNPALRRPVEDFLATVGRSSLSETDHRAARQRLLLNLRTACTSDIQTAKPKLRYDYSKRGIETQENIRGALKDVFEDLFESQ